VTELTLEREKDYQLYFLTKNPFPSVGVPEDDPPFCIGREEEISIIYRSLISSLRGFSTHLSIVAGYGNGKTHLLKYVKKEMEKILENKKSEKILVGYISCSGTSFRDIYRGFMYDIGYDFFHNLSWQVLGYTATKLIERRKLQFTEEPKKVAERLSKDLLSIKRLVDDGTVILSTLIKESKDEFLPVVKWQDFLTAFLQLTMEETGLLAWRWLSGDPTYSEQRRDLGIVTPIDTDDRALQLFICLRKILKTLGYELVCLLLDEFESIEMLIPPKRQALLNSIRHLIDLNPKGLSIIIACTPETWANIIREYHAFSERIFKEITLRPLNEQNINQFVKEYLRNSRSVSEEELARKLENEEINAEDPHLYPFTNDALKMILQTAQGNIRRTLSLCNIAIDTCSMMGSSLINEDVLKKLLTDVF
jgi:Cdc6-like AAA superfamily ATPase